MVPEINSSVVTRSEHVTGTALWLTLTILHLHKLAAGRCSLFEYAFLRRRQVLGIACLWIRDSIITIESFTRLLRQADIQMRGGLWLVSCNHLHRNSFTLYWNSFANIYIQWKECQCQTIQTDWSNNAVGSLGSVCKINKGMVNDKLWHS